MRILRVIHYVVYVVALLLFQGLIWTVLARFADEEGSALTYVVDTAAMMLPLVILQVTVATLAIKATPLRRLFVLTVAFDIGGGLLSLALVHVPEEFHPWLSWLSLGGLLSGQLFHLILPVLILWFLERRQRASRAKSQENRTLDADLETPSVVALDKGQVVEADMSKRLWSRWDIAMVVVPLSFTVLLDPLGVITYVSGLINMKVLFVAVFGFVTLIPIALLCLVALLARMLVIWPKRISTWSRLLLCWMAVISVFAACFVLPFTGLTPRPWVMYTRGFRRYVRARVDVPAVQQWLSTIDPNSLDRQDVGGGADHDSEPHPVIAGCDPKGYQVFLDDVGRPMLELRWGSGVLGTWGVTIGDADMAIPQTQPTTKETLSNGQVFYNHGQYRLPLAPGAYVWHDIE